eukprot:scaffold51358_cov34-Prasinocladus_malaysianus.AAC.3
MLDRAPYPVPLLYDAPVRADAISDRSLCAGLQRPQNSQPFPAAASQTIDPKRSELGREPS